MLHHLPWVSVSLAHPTLSSSLPAPSQTYCSAQVVFKFLPFPVFLLCVLHHPSTLCSFLSLLSWFFFLNPQGLSALISQELCPGTIWRPWNMVSFSNMQPPRCLKKKSPDHNHLIHNPIIYHVQKICVFKLRIAIIIYKVWSVLGVSPNSLIQLSTHKYLLSIWLLLRTG